MTRSSLLALALACACARPLPSKTPERAATGPAEIHWDRWQVPHIYASTRTGIGRGYGYAQLRAYPEEILRMYAVARGESAAIWGEPQRAADRMIRMLDIPRRGKQALAKQTPEMQAYLHAFADGMNAFAAAHPERLSAQAKQVLPVRPEDALAHSLHGMLAFTLLTGQRPMIMSVDGEPTPALGGPASAGSNVWAISPSRSASKHALLLANPHLPWGPPMMRFFEAHLVGPDAPLYGVTLLGSPMISIGFNDAVAWSHTVNYGDSVDFYALTPDGDGYRFDGKHTAFESRTETLRVRQADGSVREESLLVRRSVHGPVLELAGGALVAVRSAIDAANVGWVEAWTQMGRARDLAGFEAALRTMQLPMFTVVYADRDGHILFFSAGRIPKRPAAARDWFAPVPGDNSTTLWRKLLPYEAMPRIVDPPGGFVQNSNSVPWLATVPPTLEAEDFRALGIPDGPVDLRELHGLELLMGDDAISFDELRAMQRSDRLELADHVLDDLLAAAKDSKTAPVQRAAALLAGWDRRASSPGGVLFEAWADKIDWDSGFAEPWSIAKPFTTPRGLADRDGALAALEVAALEVEQRFGKLDVPWGDVRRLRADLPGVGGPDGLGSFFVVGYRRGEDGRALASSGDTFVALVELRPEGPRAEVRLSYGNASPQAPFAADQLDMLASGELRAPLLERAAIEAGAIESVALGRAE
ncbi:MAG: penicillin acylase family protein [Deltaproteobacteria bacterium]|nr:penicillin acylase family protein [Nannocystaceae bacterium]